MVIETLSEWNHWWKEKKVEADLLGKERLALRDLESSMEFREVKLFIGLRRSGKSTLLYQWIERLLSAKVKPEEVLLINFEDDVLANKSLSEVFNAYQSNINPDTKPYLFLDEVHRCKDWVLFLRKLYDLKKVKGVFITDSSSKFIEEEYSRVLTGRTISLPVFPLSFKEYLAWKGISLSSHMDREECNRLKKELLGFLEWGGFPEVFFKTHAAKKKLLTEYFSDIIHKDIVERYNISYAKIKPLADFLVSNAGSFFSPRKYSREYGLSLESINIYMGCFNEVFLFFCLPKFSYSIRTQQLSQKKVYVSDLGFFNNAGFAFSENLGRLYENAVFIELKRRGKEIFYWKGEHECDFVIKAGLNIKEAVQVCTFVTNENKAREMGGLMEALQKFKLNKGLIITQDYEATEKHNGKTIAYTPLWKWLIEK